MEEHQNVSSPHRLVEEVKDTVEVELETDDVYMNRTFGDFSRQVVLRSRGGEDTKFEYHPVSLQRPKKKLYCWMTLYTVYIYIYIYSIYIYIYIYCIYIYIYSIYIYIYTVYIYIYIYTVYIYIYIQYIYIYIYCIYIYMYCNLLQRDNKVGKRKTMTFVS